MSDKGRPWTPEEKEAHLEGWRFVLDLWKGLAGWEAEVLRALPSDADPKSGYTQRIYDIYADGRPVADAVDYVRREVIRTHEVWGFLTSGEIARLAVHDEDWQADMHMRIRDVHLGGGSADEVAAQIRLEIGAAATAPGP